MSRVEGRSSVGGHNQFYAHSIAHILLQLPPPEENFAKSTPTEQGKINAGWHGRKGQAVGQFLFEQGRG
jgi:hypothetical protein